MSIVLNRTTGLGTKALGSLILALTLGGCTTPQQSGQDLHECLNRCDTRFVGDPLAKRNCETGCIAPPSSLITTGSIYELDEGKNALNERNTTASRA